MTSAGSDLWRWRADIIDECDFFFFLSSYFQNTMVVYVPYVRKDYLYCLSDRR